MGIQISCPNAREDYLLFPPEVLEQIQLHLNFRDKLLARQVCLDWQRYIDDVQFKFGEDALVKVEDTDELIRYFDQSCSEIIWTAFSFKNLQFSRSSLSFWSSYGDQITHIEFYDCTFPQNYPSAPAEGLVKNCKNLKHLGIRNCSKYLMMGKGYFHLHKFLTLENLECLDVSQNSYLNDYALLTLLTRTKKLKSLNISESKMAFTKAVFNRFYPKVAAGEIQAENFFDFSDNVLTFHLLHFAFFSNPLASSMRELIMNETRVDIKAIQLIMTADTFRLESLHLNNCSELKANNIVEILSHEKNLKQLEIGRSKVDLLTIQNQNVDISKLEHLVVRENGEIKDASFLSLMPSLQHLDVSSCAGLQLPTINFANPLSLKVLKMRSITPFYSLKGDNTVMSSNISSIFKNLINLTELDVGVCGSAVSDEVMQTIIKRMPHLRVLNVCQSKITDRGVAGLEIDDFDPRLSPSTVMKRRHQVLERNSENEPGLCLSRLVHLKHLSLSKCQDLSEATWKHALKLPNLVSLDLSMCWQISVNGFLSIVHNCPNLENLILVQCGLHITGNQEALDIAKQNLYRLKSLQM